MKKGLLFVIGIACVNACFTNIVYAAGARYLVITHGSFYTAVLPLAEWKHKKGVSAQVVTLSETGSSETLIKNYIQNAYDTWTPRPEYVLLVGDEELVPSYYSWSSDCYTDNYYAQLDGTDLFADICVGRFSVDNVRQCSTMVAKTLGYERTPSMADSTWFERAALIVRNDGDSDDRIYYYPDAQFAYDLLTANGFSHIDTLYQRNGSHAGDVQNSVNDGCVFLGFRGSSATKWRYPFDVNPSNLQNEWKLPIVISATCLTGSFEGDNVDCELWTRAGTPQHPKGAVAYLATPTSRTSSAHIRSSIYRNFWRALFIDSLSVLGDVFVKQKLRFWNELSDRRDYEGWQLFGDPELNVWTDTPARMIVSHPSTIPLGNSQFTLTAKREGKAPIEGALVCLLKVGEIYEQGLTDASGEVSFSVTPLTHDTMWVTVTAHNHVPYEGRVIAISEGPYIALYKYGIIDTAGNDDGVVNSGERIWLPVWLTNQGDTPARAVTGILRIDDPYINVADSSEFFDSIASLDSAVTATPFEFTIVSDCPGGHEAEFELVCTDTLGNTWRSPFATTVTTPTIAFNDLIIDDAGQSNPNAFIDQGETVRLIAELENIGNAEARGVMAFLRTTDTYATITDSSSQYGNMHPGSVVDNSLGPFVVHCSSLTPLYHRIRFSLHVVSQGGYEVTKTFILKVGIGGDYLIWDPDPNHTSGSIADSLLDIKGYKGDYTTNISHFLPHLYDYQVVWMCLGVYPNHHILYAPENESAVSSLVQFLTDGGRVYMEGCETWRVHPYYSGGFLHPYFHALQDDEGYGDADVISGVTNSFASGMQFKYSGENRSMDRLRPGTGAWSLFENSPHPYTSAVALTHGAEGNGRKTMLAAFELSGLSDGAATRVTLVDSIMKWFLRSVSHDISAWSVMAPEHFFVIANSSSNPEIRIRNIGEFKETSIRVICTIDSACHTIYGDTAISSLDVGSTADIVFDPWTAGQVGQEYTFVFETQLPGDEEPQNNLRIREVSAFAFSTAISCGYTLVAPVMDGRIDTTYEWLAATRTDISNLYGRNGDSSPQPPGAVYLYTMNDGNRIYFGIDVRSDVALSDGDEFIFHFDDDHSGYYPTPPSDSTEGCLHFHYWVPNGEFQFTSLLVDGQQRNCSTDVDLLHGESIGEGNLQYEFGLPMNPTIPEYLNAAPGDTIGLSVAVGYHKQEGNTSYHYGYWPQRAASMSHPTQLGDLVIARYGVEIRDGLPKIYKMCQNRPNPFRRTSNVKYQIPNRARVVLEIYDVTGRMVRTLVDRLEEAGYKSVAWNGKDDSGRTVGSGVYWYRFEASSVENGKRFEAARKMIFLAR